MVGVIQSKILSAAPSIVGPKKMQKLRFNAESRPDIFLVVRVFNAYVRFPEIIGGTNRPDSNLIKNSNSPLLAKSGAEGVMFVTNNNDSFLFKCLDGSKRGVDLASSHYLQSIGLVSNSPFESQVELYSRNRQNNKAVEIKITKNF